MLMGRCCYLILLASLAFAATVCAQDPASTNYDESKVSTYTLPAPLVFANGKPVRTAREWMERRRGEILKLFETSVYGRSPKSPKRVRYEIFDEDHHALGGKAVRKQVSIYFSSPQGGHKEDLLLYLPADARQPVPVILSLNFGGNQSVTKDPGVKLPILWDRKTHAHGLASEESRGTDTGLDVEKTLARGFGFATIYYQDIEPDFIGGYEHGIRPLFLQRGQNAPAPDDWGAIGAWAYGLSCALDYFEKDNDVDAKRVAVMGHSRLGKTALWAGALDPRFAMVLSSCSGEGGASLARRNYGETVRNLVDVFPYWFCANFHKYAGHADQLPVDAHELIALNAPRPVYVTAAEDDKWADPHGEFLACVAAGPVYRLLGVQDLGSDQMPPLNQPIQRTLAFHYRTGKHAVTAFDWDQFLAFAESHLRPAELHGQW